MHYPLPAPSLRLVGGQILTADGLVQSDIGLDRGIILWDAPPGARDISVDGLLVLPGMIDLHGDGFERHLAPRRGVVSDQVRAFRAVEAELAQSGLTTAWLAQFWSWEGGMRSPDFAKRVASALAKERDTRRVDARLQLRLETHMFDDADDVIGFVDAYAIDYLVLNDHLAHEYLAEGRKPPRIAGAAAKAGRTPEGHFQVMCDLHARNAEVEGFIGALIPRLKEKGVRRFGSHDDADAEARARWGRLGASIAEFPTRESAVEAAIKGGEPVVMGAPNIVRGGSHNRKGLPAMPLVLDGKVDAIASDYHYPSMLAAVYKLVDAGLSFVEAWALVSTGPAEIMGLADRGRIAEGLRADIVLVDPTNRSIAGTLSQGRFSFVGAMLADRLL